MFSKELKNTPLSASDLFIKILYVHCLFNLDERCPVLPSAGLSLVPADKTQVPTGG